MKVVVEHFGYNNLPQEFKFMKSVVKKKKNLYTLSFFLLFHQTSITILTTLNEFKELKKVIIT